MSTNEPMTQEQLDAIRERLDCGTPTTEDVSNLLAEVERLRALTIMNEDMVERAAEAWYVAQNPGREDWALSAWADMGGSEPSEERSAATLAAHAALTAVLGGGDDE